MTSPVWTDKVMWHGFRIRCWIFSTELRKNSFYVRIANPSYSFPHGAVIAHWSIFNVKLNRSFGIWGNWNMGIIWESGLGTQNQAQTCEMVDQAQWPHPASLCSYI